MTFGLVRHDFDLDDSARRVETVGVTEGEGDSVLVRKLELAAKRTQAQKQYQSIREQMSLKEVETACAEAS